MSAPDPRLTNLPGVARELAVKAGYDAGERLVLHFAGQRVFVPKKIWPRSKLWKLLGPLTAKALAELFGGDTIEVPTGEGLTVAKRKLQIRNYLQGEGRQQSKNEIAGTFRVNRRTVQRHRAWLGRVRDRRQGALDLDGPSKRP